MAGNVWEWTRSLWGQDSSKATFGYPYRVDDGRENVNAEGDVYRVVRGGSWALTIDYARCAARGRIHPVFIIDDNFGFRVVVVAAPVL